jgi:hypothetical protein
MIHEASLGGMRDTDRLDSAALREERSDFYPRFVAASRGASRGSSSADNA